ncbi:MAG TPA: hypothetical protein EYQ60_19935 [Myxococcales bacterium]|nr:hypothetical protein [Myxococcales bacterium]HIL81126.1 hypothetical protein [Myxococcales bacterium]
MPAGLVNPGAIAAGYRHTCAIDDNGATCWGLPTSFSPQGWRVS